MKMSVLGFMCSLVATVTVTSAWGAQEEKLKTSDRDKVRLLVAASLTAEPVASAVTYDATYGAQCGVAVKDSDSNNVFVSACIAQFPSKKNQIVKTFAGLPFVVEALTPDKDVELSDPIRITLVGGVKEMAWKDTKSSRQPGKNHIDGQNGGVRLNGMWLLAAGTSVMDWGVLRQNRGQNIAIPERYLNKPRVWATLAKSSLIIPSAGSEVPCLCDREGFPSRIVPNAIGVIWVFDEAGTAIQIGTERYLAQKGGATIEFTSSGPVMKGVTVTQSVADAGSTQTPGALILGRITAEVGELFDKRNPPMCSLQSIRVSDLPEKFSSETKGFINWPKDYNPPKQCPYSNDDKDRIVAEGMFYTKVPSSIGEGGGFRCIGKFQVDKCLNPIDGIWDGKKEGAVHTILGKLTMFDYEFDSDEQAPLRFRATKDGYVYLNGKGRVRDLKTGETHVLDFAGASEEKELDVGYSYTSFPSYMSVRRNDGTMGPPEEKVVFGEKMQAEHALVAKIGEKQITCPLAYQDIAYFFDKGEKHTIRILAYSGCPFQIKDISIEKDIVLREETTLLVDSTRGSVLQLAKNSSLPFAAGPSGLIAICASAVNVVWSFPNTGMAFETKDSIYTTMKPGASIAFTKDGIKMDGIDKKTKAPNPK